MSKFKVGDKVRTLTTKGTFWELGSIHTIIQDYHDGDYELDEEGEWWPEDELELVPEVYLCDTCGKAKNECPIYPPKTCPSCVEYREIKEQTKSEKEAITEFLSESTTNSETKEVTVTMESVNHPAHYGGEDATFEAIKVIEAWNLGFCLGNTVKYISRAGKKDPSKTVEDLKKALWYLDREITRIENAGKP